MVLKELVQRIKEKRAVFKEMKDNDRMQETLQQRKKNSNERELERFMEEERQKDIIEQLKMFRSKRNEENRKQTILGNKNIFKGHTNILTDNKKLFSMHSNLGGQGIFFK